MKKQLKCFSLKIQRLVFFLLIAYSPQLFSQTVEEKLSLSIKDVSVEDVFKQIQKETNYLFFYNATEIPLKKLVSLDKNNSTITEVMDALAQQVDFTYTIKARHIIVSPSDIATKKREISGRVLDAEGEPIIGASIVFDAGGTPNGTISDFDGNFVLRNIPEKGKLKVSYIGYQSQDLTLSSKNLYNVTLVEDTKLLDEVVVTAMGIERKAESLTYATQKVGGEELTRVKDANFINSLQGKISGLSITPNAGGAGGSSKIVLRGNSSVLGNNQPLIVVNGVPISNKVSGQRDLSSGGYDMAYAFNTEGSDAMSTINPDDIESINVLKGANAAALYGSAAANGVIMITTKQGAANAVRVDVSSSSTFETPLLLPRIQNTYGANVSPTATMPSSDGWGKKIVDMTEEDLAYKNAVMRGKGKDDVADFFNIGATFNNSVAISGGNETAKTYFSYGNSKAFGMMPNNSFTRHSFNFRENISLFKNKLNLDFSLSYTKQSTLNRPGGGTTQNPLFHLYNTPRNIDMDYYKNNYKVDEGTWMSNSSAIYVDKGSGNYKKELVEVELKGPQQVWAYNTSAQNNPYWIVNMNKRQLDIDRIFGNFSASYEFFPGLKAQTRLSLDNSSEFATSKIYATTQNPNAMIDRGNYIERRYKNSEIYLDGMLSYNATFSDFSLSATAGGTMWNSFFENFTMNESATSVSDGNSGVNKEIVPTAVNLFYPSSGEGGSRSYNPDLNWSRSLFSTVQLGYKDFAFVDASYREDWYYAFKQFSKYGVPSHYGYYSFGANALLHKIVSLPEEYINHLKLRVSYSEVGNSIPNIFFESRGISQLTGAVAPSPYKKFENPVPEKTKSFEAGFDVSFLSNAFHLDFTYYNTGMFNSYLLISGGLGAQSQPVNSGVVRNQGVETLLSYSLNITKNLQWKTGLNFAYNNNKILRAGLDKSGNDAAIEQSIADGKMMLKYQKGGSYGDLWVTDYRRNEDGKIYLDATGTPKQSLDQFGLYMGNMNANITLGLSNTFAYKNLALYFLIDGKLGGKVVSFTEATLDAKGLSQRTADARLAAEANEELKFNGEPAMQLADGQLAPIDRYFKQIGDDINASEYVYDATNFRLRELTLSYLFPDLFGSTKNLSLSLVARNLFFLYNKAPIDPDTSLSTQNGLGGFEIFSMPAARSFGLNFSLSF